MDATEKQLLKVDTEQAILQIESVFIKALRSEKSRRFSVPNLAAETGLKSLLGDDAGWALARAIAASLERKGIAKVSYSSSGTWLIQLR